MLWGEATRPTLRHASEIAHPVGELRRVVHRPVADDVATAVHQYTHGSGSVVCPCRGTQDRSAWRRSMIRVPARPEAAPWRRAHDHLSHPASVVASNVISGSASSTAAMSGWTGYRVTRNRLGHALKLVSQASVVHDVSHNPPIKSWVEVEPNVADRTEAVHLQRGDGRWDVVHPKVHGAVLFLDECVVGLCRTSLACSMTCFNACSVVSFVKVN